MPSRKSNIYPHRRRRPEAKKGDGRYIDISYDNYGYLPGDFVIWNDMSPKKMLGDDSIEDVGVYIGSTSPGRFEILFDDTVVAVHWNEVKPIGFKARRHQYRS